MVGFLGIGGFGGRGCRFWRLRGWCFLGRPDVWKNRDHVASETSFVALRVIFNKIDEEPDTLISVQKVYPAEANRR